MRTKLLTLLCFYYFSPFAFASNLEEAKQTIKAQLEEAARQDTFSGAVLIAKEDKIIFEAAYGMASKRFDVPNTLHTRFNLGSMNKMFTAIATLQLVEQGKLSLTDTLDMYAEESWLPKEISQKIQIQHLLTHASGLGSYFKQEFFDASRYKFVNIEDFKPLVVTEELAFEPGTNYRYSNTGMLMLGVVIQKASGQDYYDYVRDHIYKVADMTNTGCFDMDQPFKNVAIGYHPTDESTTGFSNNLFLHVIKGGPAGGCFSTVADLYHFSLALTKNKLLNETNTLALFNPKSEFHQESYGYGFKVSGTPDNRIVGHSGGFYGISANLDIFLDRGFIVAILSNYSDAARPVTSNIRELLAATED